MSQPRNIPTEVTFVPAGTEVGVDVGGGWARKKLTEDCYQCDFPSIHGSEEHTVYIPARMIRAADDQAADEGLIERPGFEEDEWPHADISEDDRPRGDDE